MSGVQQLAAGFWTGTDDLREYVEGLCRRVDERDPLIQSFLSEPGRRNRLMKEIEALEGTFRSGGRMPPLFGIPVGIKDLFHVEGFETRAGSRLPPELFGGPEASVVSLLKQQGALIFGKTVATEFAFAEPGPTRNPWNTEHTPGGSSSGSAAAVAAGFVPLALGTQTIGSVARPASFCGVVGYKPTYGRIPIDGCVPFSPAVDHVGFFTADVESVACVAAALVTGWQPVEGGEAALPQCIGWVVGAYWEQCDPCMRDLVEARVAGLEEQGVRVVRLDLFPDWSDWVEAHYDLIAAEFAAVHAPWLEAYGELYRPRTLELIEKGQRVSAERLTTVRTWRRVARQRIMDAMQVQGIACWITPSALGGAPAGLDSTGSPLMNLPWSYSGLPSLSVPAGRTETGLPLGIQWVGPYGADEWLVRQLWMARPDAAM